MGVLCVFLKVLKVWGKKSKFLSKFFALQDAEVKEAYSAWLKTKQKQQKQDKLLKKRQEMESTEGFYIRSRQECDQAFRQ